MTKKNDMFRIEMFEDGSNEALKIIMDNAKRCNIKVFMNPIMRLGMKIPKGFDVIFLQGSQKSFIRYYINDFKEKRVSLKELAGIIKSLF